MNKFEQLNTMFETISVQPSAKIGIIVEGRMYKMTSYSENPKSMPIDVAALCDFIVDLSNMRVLKSSVDMDAELKQQVAFTVNAYGHDLGGIRFLKLSERWKNAGTWKPTDIVEETPEVQAAASAELMAAVNGWQGDDVLHDEDCPVCHPHLHQEEQ